MLDWQPLLECVESRLAQQSADSRRLFHGRGGCFPGLESVCVDSFSPALLVTLFAPYIDEIALVHRLWQLAKSFNYTGLAVQRRYQRAAPIAWEAGEPVDALFARRGELQFPLTVERQNVGFFLDIESGRRWLEHQVKHWPAEKGELRLLNLFAFTCAFSVVARAAGALSVVNIDLNKGVLNRGRANHEHNSVPLKGLKFLQLDALRDFKRFDRRGPFQLLVVDPPTRQKGSFEVSENYSELLKKLPDCLAAEADILLVLNSPSHSEAYFRQLIAAADPRYCVLERLAQNADFADKNADAALKMLHVQFRR